MPDWQPEPRPIPRELEHPHEHAYYAPQVEWLSIEDKLNSLSSYQWLTFAKHVDVV